MESDTTSGGPDIKTGCMEASARLEAMCDASLAWIEALLTGNTGAQSSQLAQMRALLASTPKGDVAYCAQGTSTLYTALLESLNLFGELVSMSKHLTAIEGYLVGLKKGSRSTPLVRLGKDRTAYVQALQDEEDRLRRAVLDWQAKLGKARLERLDARAKALDVPDALLSSGIADAFSHAKKAGKANEENPAVLLGEYALWMGPCMIRDVKTLAMAAVPNPH